MLAGFVLFLISGSDKNSPGGFPTIFGFIEPTAAPAPAIAWAHHGRNAVTEYAASTREPYPRPQQGMLCLNPIVWKQLVCHKLPIRK